LDAHASLRDEFIRIHGYAPQGEAIDEIICGLEADQEKVDTGAMEQSTMQVYCAPQYEPQIMDQLVEHAGTLADIASRERYRGQLNEIRNRADVLAINLLDEQRRLSLLTTNAGETASPKCPHGFRADLCRQCAGDRHRRSFP
jgi:hypothetical protein